MLRDNHTILLGGEDSYLYYYNMNTEQLQKSEVNNGHKGCVSKLLMIDEHSFLSCSKDYTIKVWNNKRR